MFRQIIIAAAAAGLVATTATATAASSQGRHSSGFYGAPYGYGSGERSDPTNTNGNG
jgi:hypothetical protein